MSCSVLALLLGTFLDVGAQTILQWPVVEVRQVGSPLSLQCTVTGTSNPTLYWYWQAKGGAPQLLFYSLGMDDIQGEAPKHFSAFRPKDGQFTLSADKLQPGDSGVYLCAWDAHCASRPRGRPKTHLEAHTSRSERPRSRLQGVSVTGFDSSGLRAPEWSQLREILTRCSERNLTRSSASIARLMRAVKSPVETSSPC